MSASNQAAAAPGLLSDRLTDPQDHHVISIPRTGGNFYKAPPGVNDHYWIRTLNRADTRLRKLARANQGGYSLYSGPRQNHREAARAAIAYRILANDLAAASADASLNGRKGDRARALMLHRSM